MCMCKLMSVLKCLTMGCFFNGIGFGSERQGICYLSVCLGVYVRTYVSFKMPDHGLFL